MPNNYFSVDRNVRFCQECDKQLSKMAYYYDYKLCKSCSNSKNSKIRFDNLGRKPKKHKCLDCDKLVGINYKRCHSCSAKVFLNKPEFKERLRERLKGSKNPMFGKKHKVETIRNIVTKININRKSPNNFEKEFIVLLDKLNLNKYKFVGNGKFFVENFNPDFVCEEDKKIIELYGDYWHRKEKNVYGYDLPRIEAYSRNGYDCSIIWQSEFKNNREDVIKQIKLLEELKVYA